MGSLNSDEEEYRFLDAHEFIDLTPDSDSDSLDSPNSRTKVDNETSSSFNYELWIRSPKSVQERRSEFFRMMGLRLEDRIIGDNSVDEYGDIFKGESNRIKESSGAVLRSPIFEYEFSSSRSSLSSWSDGAWDTLEGTGSVGNFICRTGNSGGGELNQHGPVVEEYDNTCRSSSPFVVSRNKSWPKTSRLKKRWLSRLRSFSCIVDRQTDDDNLRPRGSNPVQLSRVERVKVRHRRKRLKELSALFKGQDIPAHEGSILAMKFSVDGQYLASAGKDGIVRVWQVVETERSNEVDLPEIDPSCLYLTVNQLSEVAPLVAEEKDKMGKIKSVGKTSDSACVIFPPKVFRILEKPLHEFHGHTGDILDLSWSRNHCILSSSVDNTVRLWRVGCDQCLEVFSHSNYVTCVQFNPVDDNYFISGSIDGKVRIWVINGCHVVDWTDVRDIVTAVSYLPDGQGGISGSMAGHCHFFSVSDNHLQMEDHLCLNFKKKSPYKRITGFEFFPQDPSKVLVTCADSKVRVLCGTNEIGKYRGLQKGVKQLSAVFTSDGKHIVSACDDSNIYVWNCINREPCQPKTVRSFECFTSDASVAIPWSGPKFGNSVSPHTLDKDSPPPTALPFSSSAFFSLLCQEYVESIPPKGSATWPEEKLPSSCSSPRAVSSPMHNKSQYKFLKSSYNSSASSHAWGLVIVTAGWDGRIRSFLNYGLPLLL